ncbi:MAG: murein L,D-transpeptidase family protein [Pseudomonadota bacterium]
MSLVPQKFALSRRTLVKGLLLASAAPMLAACQSEYGPKHLQPLPASLQLKMERLAMSESDPIYMRIFKEEGELEVWKRGPSGRFMLLESYEICTWSGELGPKFQEGDRQAPEGFYTITPAQMNPNSSFYLSFNLGFPNAYDRSHGRTGSHLMVHGACSSAGCYAMTDDQIAEIYALGREAFEGGQRAFQVHAFPFRMTPENMARHAGHQHFAFWEMLQEGYQHFELTQLPPQVNVCDRRYIFNAVAAEQFSAAEQCPAYTMPEPIASSFQAAQVEHRAAFEVALAEYHPGGVVAPAVGEPTIAADRVLVATTPQPVAPPTPSPVTPSAPAPVVATAPAAPVAPPLAETIAAPVSGPTPPPGVETAAVEAAPASAPAANDSFMARAGSLFDGMFSGN